MCHASRRWQLDSSTFFRIQFLSELSSPVSYKSGGRPPHDYSIPFNMTAPGDRYNAPPNPFRASNMHSQERSASVVSEVRSTFCRPRLKGSPHCQFLCHKLPPRSVASRPLDLYDMELRSAGFCGQSPGDESDGFLDEGSSGPNDREGVSVENSLRVRFTATN